MMNVLKEVVLNHYKKYPLMQIKDFIKLFYQNSFGPLHMSANAGVDDLAKYIEDELEYLIEPSLSNQVESIGNDYYRLDLHMVKDAVVTVKDLADMFYQSILSSPSMEDDDIDLFTKQLEMLRYLVLENQIALNIDDVDEYIDTYLYEGIRPLHHSQVYKDNYHPHYRVIQKKYMTEIIGVE